MRLQGNTFIMITATAVLCLAAHALGGQSLQCRPLPNGSFSQGLAGWTLTPVQTPSGDAGAFVSFNLVDASSYQGLDGSQPFDANTAQMFVSAAAGLSGGTGSAVAEARLSMPFIVTGRYLRLTSGGSFEFQFFGSAERGLLVAAEIDGPGKADAEAVLYSSHVDAAPGCVFGLSILGTLDEDPPTTTIDLFDAGMVMGDYAMLTVRLIATAQTIDPCQWSIAEAVMLADQFQMCIEPNPADLNGDGVVNGLDLAIMLGQWTGPLQYPACPPHAPADLNQDCRINGQDIAVLLGAWG